MRREGGRGCSRERVCDLAPRLLDAVESQSVTGTGETAPLSHISLRLWRAGARLGLPGGYLYKRKLGLGERFVWFGTLVYLNSLFSLRTLETMTRAHLT